MANVTIARIHTSDNLVAFSYYTNEPGRYFIKVMPMS